MLNPEAVVSKVYALPAVLIERSLKVASPPDAETVKDPDKVPLPGLLLMAMVIESVAVVTRLPPASYTWTLIAGEIVAVDTALVGSTL